MGKVETSWFEIPVASPTEVENRSAASTQAQGAVVWVAARDYVGKWNPVKVKTGPGQLFLDFKVKFNELD